MKKKFTVFLILIMAVMLVSGISFATISVYAYEEGSIEGTTGTGTEENPVCVDSAYELKQALERTDITHVRLTQGFSQELDDDAQHGNWNTLNDYYIAVTSNKTLTLDGDALVFTRYAAGGETVLRSFITITSNATLTLSGEGKLLAEFGMMDGENCAVVRVQKGALVVDGAMVAVGDYGDRPDINGNAVFVNQGSVTVNSGQVEGYTVNSTNTTYKENIVRYAIKANIWGTVTVNGGIISVYKEKSDHPLDPYFPISAAKAENVTVNGGCFDYFDEKAKNDYVASGVSVVDPQTGNDVTLPSTNEVLVLDKVHTLKDVTVAFAVPEPNALAQFTPTSISNPNVDVEIEWRKSGTNEKLNPGDRFAPLSKYVLFLTVLPKAGYKFMEGYSSCTINGNMPLLKNGQYDLISNYSTDVALLDRVEASVTAPVIGQKPDYNVSFTNGSLIATHVTWNENHKAMHPDDVFKRGCVYEVNFLVNRYEDTSFIFTNATVVTVNGQEISGCDIYPDVINLNSVTMIDASPIEVTEVSATVTKPVAGAKPDMAPVAGADTRIINIEWYKCKSDGDTVWRRELKDDEVFEYGYYMAYIMLYPGVDVNDIGVIFGTPTTHTINGNEVQIYSRDTNYVTLKAFFTVGGDVENINITADEPIAGGAYFYAQATAESATLQETIWYEYSNGVRGEEFFGRFKKDRQYEAVYKFKYDTDIFAGDFTSNTKVTVNGEPATVVSFDNATKEIVVSAVYTCTKEQQIIERIDLTTVRRPEPGVSGLTIGGADATPSLDFINVSSGKWRLSDDSDIPGDVFALGYDYKYSCNLTLDVESALKYKLTEDTEVYINGVKADYVDYITPVNMNTYMIIECHNHEGGEATCTEQALCDICGAPYGELDVANHEGVETFVPGGNGTHSVYCKACGELKTVEPCSFDPNDATCLAFAKCAKCEGDCGEKNENNHTKGSFVYTPNADNATHTKKHECCGAVVTAEEAHAFGSGNVCDDCGYDKTVLHVHAYTEENATPEFLKTPATCTEKAVYYKSCECGLAGAGTFENGEPLGHDFANGTEYSKDENGHQKKCSRCDAYDTVTAHNYGGDNVCDVCGYDETVPHVHAYIEENATEKYLKAPANCTDKAVYYKSCSCGAKGTETFESGEPLGHSYGDDNVCDVCGYEQTVTPDPATQPEKEGLSAGAIAAIAVGGVVVLGGGGFAIYWFIIRKKKFGN